MTPLRPLILLAVVTALGCATGQPVTPTSTGASLAPGMATTAIEGDARFPAEMAEGGQVIPTGIGSYRVQHSVPEVPIPGAIVTARDPVTRAPLPVPAATTDAQGRFRLDGLTAGENHLVEVAFRAADGSREYRLLAIGRAGEPIAVSWRSTAVVTALLQDPGQQNLKHLDLAPLRSAEVARDAEADALPPEARKTLLTGLLVAPTGATGSVLPLPSLAPLPVPSILPSLLPSALPSVLPSTGLLGQTTSAVASVVPNATGSLIPALLPGLGGSSPSPAPTPAPSSSAGLVETVVDTVEDTVEETTENLPLPLPSIKLF